MLAQGRLVADSPDRRTEMPIRQPMSEWTYYTLFDRRGYAVGYLREREGRKQYWGGGGKRWFAASIACADRVRLRQPPAGLDSCRGAND